MRPDNAVRIRKDTEVEGNPRSQTARSHTMLPRARYLAFLQGCAYPIQHTDRIHTTKTQLTPRSVARARRRSWLRQTSTPNHLLSTDQR